jgi:hypothetical protein
MGREKNYRNNLHDVSGQRNPKPLKFIAGRLSSTRVVFRSAYRQKLNESDKSNLSTKYATVIDTFSDSKKLIKNYGKKFVLRRAKWKCI